MTQSYSNPLDWKILKGQSKERWRSEKEDMEAWGWDREDRAMKIKCLSCGQQITLGDEIYDFWGSVKCFYCRTVMEIQAARGVLIWLNPFSIVNPGYAARSSQHHPYAEQKKI